MKQDCTHIVLDDPLPCLPMLYIMFPSFFNVYQVCLYCSRVFFNLRMVAQPDALRYSVLAGEQKSLCEIYV